MDELVRVAGFKKIAMNVDHWGMFTVSIARKAEAGRALGSKNGGQPAA